MTFDNQGLHESEEDWRTKSKMMRYRNMEYALIWTKLISRKTTENYLIDKTKRTVLYVGDMQYIYHLLRT